MDVSIIQKNAKGIASEPVRANFIIDRTPPTFKLGISADGGPFTYYDKTQPETPFKHIWKNKLMFSITDIKNDISGISEALYDLSPCTTEPVKYPINLKNLEFLFTNPKNHWRHYIRTYLQDRANNHNHIFVPCIHYKDIVIIDKKITYANPTKKDKELSINFNGNTIAEIVNKTNNYTLKKDKDYEVKTDKIILKNEYLSNLDNKTYNLEISVYPRGETNLDLSIILPKYTATLHIATFDGLNNDLKYTYGDNPGKIFLNCGNETVKATYSSTNSDVAEIDENTGKLTIKKVGEFK